VASDLLDLFRDGFKVEGDLVASDPQSLSTISDATEEQDFVVEKIRELENVELKVDYSDFSNFVFFNSAFDYFNITGEKILNEYPFDGSRAQLQKFTNDLDGYQKHVLKSWPSYAGHMRFDSSISSSYILIEDVGDDGGSYRTGILSPHTSSISVSAWLNVPAAMTGTEEVQVILQKVSGSNEDGYTLYLTGSEVRFRMKSGSVVNEATTEMALESDQYVEGVFDATNTTGSILIFTGSSTQYPILANSSSLTIFERIDLAGTSMSVASGTMDGKNVTFFTGSLDDVKVWKKPRTLANISSSFNVKQYAEENLVALFRFNGSGSAQSTSHDSVVIDYSGRGLNGRVQNYYDAMRGSGSLLASEKLDPVLLIDAKDVVSYIGIQQTSGSDYDRQNENIITNMLPEQFFVLEEFKNTEILKNFLYVSGRHFDSIKLHIDQFTNILKTSYGDFDQTPDALLDVVAKFFGWEFTGNFLNKDAFQYLLGRNVLQNLNRNNETDVALFEIKNQFWRRVLINLMHFYKTKGTRESVKALLRAYGINENFVRIKEFGHTPNVGVRTERIKADKSVPVLGFGSGSLTGSITLALAGDNIPGTDFTVETRVKFPLTSSSDITATKLSGTLWSLVDGDTWMTMRYEKDSVGSHSGTLLLSSSDGTNQLSAGGLGIFNNEWQNISFIMSDASSSLNVNIRELDEDEIDIYTTSSLKGVSSGLITTATWDTFHVGATASFDAEYWMQEARLWTRELSKEELDDHTLNFQSYGVSDIVAHGDNLRVNWRLNEDLTASVAGVIEPRIEDFSMFENHGRGSGFNPSNNAYKRTLNDYNYIASLDFGWSDDKVRIFDAPEIKQSEFVNDSKMISLEFNMIDSLNEDIVQIVQSMDMFNEAVGFPANKYRVQYEDLETYREHYFKRLQGRLNFTLFADLLDFFDRSFIDMVRKLIPARAYFMGDELVVESHMLERPKIVYERRREQDVQFIPTGGIEMWTRFGQKDDKTGRKFPRYITGSIGV